MANIFTLTGVPKGKIHTKRQMHKNSLYLERR